MANIFGKAASWVDKRLFGSGPADTYGSEFDAAGRTARNYGDDASREYMERAKGFDAQGALQTAAGGLFDQFERGVGQKIETIRGRQVGSGRLGGGYGDMDETAAVYDARAQLNNQIAAMALQAEGLQMQNDRGLGEFGQQQQGQYLDILAGQRDAETARRNAQDTRRAGFWGGLTKLATNFIPVPGAKGA